MIYFIPFQCAIEHTHSHIVYMYQLFALPMSALCGFECVYRVLARVFLIVCSLAKLARRFLPPSRLFCLPLSLTVHLLKICALYSLFCSFFVCIRVFFFFLYSHCDYGYFNPLCWFSFSHSLMLIPRVCSLCTIYATCGCTMTSF